MSKAQPWLYISDRRTNEPIIALHISTRLSWRGSFSTGGTLFTFNFNGFVFVLEAMLREESSKNPYNTIGDTMADFQIFSLFFR